ncbi:MAG TPA: IPT/TIG domain-containing protein [Bryobacteraceae bacterium]|nr:IPT/TIG domain-containing protein [Bryobacteraceae bacterium]
MFRKNWILAIASVAAIAMTAVSAHAGTFGTVVAIGGEAADIALDPTRGVLYIANFTANRIDVMTLSNNTIQTSINVPNQPSSISVSPDAHWLLVANYGNNTTGSSTNALTLIDLTNANAKQTFSLSNPPLTVSFGLDNKALVVTTGEFIIFDPTVGTTTLIRTIAQAATQAIPQPPQTFPAGFTQASAAVSGDGLTIAGEGGGTTSGILEYRYSVATHGLSAVTYISSPTAGPRVVSLSNDGTLSTFDWTVQDTNLNVTAQFANPAGLLSLGSTLIDSSRGLIYAQIPISGTSATANTAAPILAIVDWDNLTLEDRIQLPENLSGKSILSADNNTMYAISDSGVMILPVGNLKSYPRLSASTEDVVFRGNFCNRNITTQTFTITDPGGGHTPFSISTTSAGISVSPSSGVTPATVSVAVDPNAFSAQKGTVAAYLTISSNVAIDLPPAIRVLINSQDPSQRGTFVDVPGTVVDLLADPKRNVYYVLRQDKNQVLVYNASNNTLNATLRTCTTPKGMAITFDQQDLLVGCDNAHYMSVFDLDLLTAQQPIYVADYVQSVAASANAILVHVRPIVSKNPGLGRVDMIARVVTQLPTLGVYQNSLPLDTVLAAPSNGSNILIASSDGSVMLYDANADSFTVSRKDFTALSGAYAASNFKQFVVGTNLLDASLVPKGQILTSAGTSSGFSFVNNVGYYTSATTSSSPGTIEQVNLTTGNGIQPTAIVEAPILGASSSTTAAASTTTPVSPTAASNVSVFTRSLAPLPTQTSIIVLSTSGFTVLPWTYSASVPSPIIAAVVSAADSKSAAAPGGLITLYGSNLSPTNLATSQIPVPTALANSCITVNGQPIPLIFVSPTQINAQMPFQAVGAETIVVHTPGGTSDNFNLTVQPTAPAVFLSGVAGPQTNLPTIIRAANATLATDANPIHPNDVLVIYVTGLGQTNPAGLTGYPAPGNPLSNTLTPTTVMLGGMNLPVEYAGLAPGEVGVYQINVTVPGNIPTGLSLPLVINEGSGTVTVSMRVIP